MSPEIVNDEALKSILQSRHLPDKEFNRISAIIYDLCRINLHVGKKELVQARLNKRLRQLGMSTYAQYLDFVERDETGAELATMTDFLSTNLTSFFREKDHFDYLRDEYLKKIDTSKTRKLRFWCAGCSSGEEAYSLAMVIRESLPDIDSMNALILATDISRRMLNTARRGIYSEQRFGDTLPALKLKYFERLNTPGEKEFHYRARPEITDMIRFRYLNLAGKWPATVPFDVIFCRNVMIYFDKETQAEMVKRFCAALKPGGMFMSGHSESLTNIRHELEYVRPSIYIKP